MTDKSLKMFDKSSSKFRWQLIRIDGVLNSRPLLSTSVDLLIQHNFTDTIADSLIFELTCSLPELKYHFTGEFV